MSEPLINISQLRKPYWCEMEIAVLGKYHGDGESLVIHLYNDEWMIIDSFSSHKTAAPLYYLSLRGFKTEEDWGKVKYVICTHWHSDHISQLDEVVKKCKKATFLFMEASKDMVKLIVEDSKKYPAEAFADSNTMLFRCMQAANELDSLVEGKEFEAKFKHKYNPFNTRLFATSPSNEVIRELVAALFKQGEKVFESAEKNKMSIGVIIDNMFKTMLLAGDLERESNDRTINNQHCDRCLKTQADSKYGWCRAIGHCSPLMNVSKRFSYYKIPHHASVTGYCNSLYQSYINKHCVGVCTSFAKRHLPEEGMLAEYWNRHSNGLYYMKENEQEIEPNDETSYEGQDGVDCKPIEDKLGVVISRSIMCFPWRTMCYGHSGKYGENN